MGDFNSLPLCDDFFSSDTTDGESLLGEPVVNNKLYILYSKAFFNLPFLEDWAMLNCISLISTCFFFYSHKTLFLNKKFS